MIICDFSQNIHVCVNTMKLFWEQDSHRAWWLSEMSAFSLMF